MKKKLMIKGKPAYIWIPSIYGNGAQWKYEGMDAWISWVPKSIKDAIKLIKWNIKKCLETKG